MTDALKIAEKLVNEQDLTDSEYLTLISMRNTETAEFLRNEAQKIAEKVFGKKVFIRGLIEFTNYCKNNCYYCGIRCGNKKAERYRLTKEQILNCCNIGYPLGFRTFVLQGGEDPYFDDEKICDIIWAIKTRYQDCAVTLSMGERSEESYLNLFKAGADRYLLRHETATEEHYKKLHPSELSLHNRLNCLKVLKKTGFQTGCGFMVGSPYQTYENIVADLRFIKEFNPHMVGIGPFLSHNDTPFREMKNGTPELTLYLLSMIRIMLPKVLLPATTALGTVKNGGREEGILHGANVVMPNLSPIEVRDKYLLYNNKLSSGTEAAETVNQLAESLAEIGYKIAIGRGDSPF